MLVVSRILINAYRLLTWPLWVLLRRAGGRSPWVQLALHGQVEELRAAPTSGLAGLLSRLRPKPPSVADVRLLAERMAKDPDATGLLLSLSTLRSGWSTLSALRRVVQDLVKSGKRVVVFLPEGASQRELYVASAGSTVTSPPSAGFSLLGPLARRSYVAPLLARLGVQVQVVAQGRFKTAAEALVRSDMSEAEREQSEALVTTLKGALSRALSERTTAAPPELLFERALFGAPEAKELGLLDACGYRDELESSLELTDDEPALPARKYLRRTRPRGLLPLRRRPRVAVLVLHGPIGDLSSGRSIALKSASAALKALRERKDVCGVIIHLDSPGGSAVVSDLLHREVSRLVDKKPVVAWLGNVAASGGYYLAAAAQRIVADPCTITGSIGVISAHFAAEQLLSRAGVRSEVVKLTPYADLASFARPLNDGEGALLFRESQRFYERFLEVVAQGRGLSLERVRELAQGRVWSGLDGAREGLVDVLGGYAEALAELRILVDATGTEGDYESPLVVHPTRSRGSDWGGAHLGLPFELEQASQLFQLANRNGCSVLTYALDAVGTEA